MMRLRVGDEQIELSGPKFVDFCLQRSQSVGSNAINALAPNLFCLDKSGIDEQQQML